MKSLQERQAERDARREEAGLEPIEYPVVGVVLTSTEDKEIAAKAAQALASEPASGNGAGAESLPPAPAPAPAGKTAAKSK